MTTVEDVLAHHGVKGMHWGIRNAEKKAAKADDKWQKNIYSLHGAIAVHNKTAERMNNVALPELNNRPEFKNHVDRGGQLLDMNTGVPVGKVGRKYYAEYHKLVAHHTAQAIKDVHGTSPSGRLKATLDTSPADGWRVKVSPTNVQHGIAGMNDIKPEPISVPNTPELLMDVNHDDSGMVTSHKKIKTPVAHSDAVDEHLEHYGIKGMHWGVRKSSVTSRDAQKARTIGKKAQKNKTGAQSLSNKEIQQYLARAKLEQQYKGLHPGKVARGHKFVKTSLEVAGTAGAVYKIYKSPTVRAVAKSLARPAGAHYIK